MPPSGEEWLHEIKHDGYRVQAHFDGEPRIYTRRGNEWAARMPTISAALKALPANNLVLDGELVALDRAGKPSFYEHLCLRYRDDTPFVANHQPR